MPARKIQFLAYYLPQFHPIPENDKWWGTGFTEWTNVAKARPLFNGHYQPILPADLGFYDLRVPEVQREQAKLAKRYGIDGFIYYQYWFGNGKMLLERPAEQMLKDRSVSIPFCFCWANETWKGIWHGLDNPTVLMEQTYQGKEGYIAYFNYLLPFFKDKRYIKVNNMPMFHILKIDDIPDSTLFVSTFNELAIQQGFNGVYFITTGNIHSQKALLDRNIFGIVGLDAFNNIRYSQNSYFSKSSFFGKIELKLKKMIGHSHIVGRQSKPLIIDYQKGVASLNIQFPNEKYIPCVFPNWDNSARSGKKSLIFKNAAPKAWQMHLQKSVDKLKENQNNPPYIIIKSWNEWAEGNYLEPDQRYGHQFLKVIKKIKDQLT